MTILEAEYNGLQIGDNSIVTLEFEFEESKTFEINLQNTSPTDDIEQIDLVTNLPPESFLIVDKPTELQSGESGTLSILVDSNKLIEFADAEGNPAVQFGFTYLRKRKLFS